MGRPRDGEMGPWSHQDRGIGMFARPVHGNLVLQNLASPYWQRIIAHAAGLGPRRY